MLLKSIIIVPILWIAADAARILVVIPEPSHSHQVAFRPIITELARRGHKLTVFTPIPINDSTLQNYTEVKLSYSSYKVDEKFDVLGLAKLGIWPLLDDFYRRNEEMTDSALSHPVMQQLISSNSTEKFDLIIVEFLFYDAFYALSHRFNASLIGIASVPLTAFHHYTFGNSISWAYAPDLLANDLDENMNTWDRIYNAYCIFYQLYWHQYKIIPVQEKIVRKHFGDSVPPAHQLASNMALLLANFHSFLYPHANVPGIISIRGSRQITQKKRLPADLEKILDDAKEGCIYFSLGSNVKGEFLPVERRDMFQKTFEKLPYKVLWKYESDFPNKSNNIITRKWLPQHEVLAHPNVRLFMYQGGLQSTEETIENGVPVIGFPIFGDQHYNVKQLVARGAGKKLIITDINEDELREAILEVITTSSYKENMLKLRDLLHDVPYDPLNNSVWWVEHVIRHDGAPHLRNKSRDMPWYMTQLLDILGIILLVTLLVILAIILLVSYIIIYCRIIKRFKRLCELIIKPCTRLFEPNRPVAKKEQ
ncbi:unnamed protein product [Lasius platythorax]|uniref:UDP-glycosyltransferase n=1 Tax=Lasius platythorax TaxID=488582 RepID=A0AAV2NU92_9HYME